MTKRRKASGDLLELLGIDLWDDPSYVLRDQDCTIYTPVHFGVKQEEIYGRGRKIFPRRPGRQDTEYFRQNYLEFLDPLEEYDLFVILFSGGKDSTACFLKLLEMAGVEKKKGVSARGGRELWSDPHGILDKIEIWHHDIDGGSSRTMDWKCTKNYVKAFAEYFGVKLRISYRQGGFYDELYRIGSSKPVSWIDPESGEVFDCRLSRNQLASEEIRKSNMPEEKKVIALSEYGYRRKFPAKSGILNGRWCSSVLKGEVSASVFSNWEGAKGKKTLVISGERRGESSPRSNYNECELDRSHAQVRSNRTVHHWRSCIDWTEKDVWTIHCRWGLRAHACYESGWSRCSCAFCVFSSPCHFKGLSEVYPEEYEALCNDEKVLQFTLDNEKSLPEFVGDAVSCVYPDPKALWHLKTGLYSVDDIAVAEGTWHYPAGAFHGSEGGPC